MTCPHCLRFTLDPYLLGLFESARHRGDVRILHLLPRWSQAARQTAGEGGRLNLIAEHWQAVASCATPGDREPIPRAKGIGAGTSVGTLSGRPELSGAPENCSDRKRPTRPPLAVSAVLMSFPAISARCNTSSLTSKS